LALSIIVLVLATRKNVGKNGTKNIQMDKQPQCVLELQARIRTDWDFFVSFYLDASMAIELLFCTAWYARGDV
jgi:hypothetical protein